MADQVRREENSTFFQQKSQKLWLKSENFTKMWKLTWKAIEEYMIYVKILEKCKKNHENKVTFV